MGGLGLGILQLTGFRLNIVSKFSLCLIYRFTDWFGHESRLLLKARMFARLAILFFKGLFSRMVSTDMWQTQRSLGIFLLALFMWSHSFLKLHFEVLSEEESKLKCQVLLGVRQAQRRMDFLYREEPGELTSWKNQFY